MALGRGRSAKVRLAIAVGVFVSMFFLIGAAFWYQDMQYSYPTPKPRGLKQPAIGSQLGAGQPTPKLIHFYNPDCPCSQFNTEHLRELVEQFRGQVRFEAVLQSRRKDALARWQSLKLDIPARLDPDGKIADQYGIYSTPQAVVEDSQGRLYFRGNYNVSRYCTDKSTEFARIAIESVLATKPLPTLPSKATVAYGCPLPKKP